eukprot:483005_1
MSACLSFTTAFVLFISFSVSNVLNPILSFNMSQISPNGRVKPIPVQNWGKKYRPIRVWCCVVALPDPYELLVIQDTYGQYCDNLLFFVGDNTQTQIEHRSIDELNPNHTPNTHHSTIKNVIYLPLRCTGSGLPIDRWEKNWKMYQYLYTFHSDEFEWIIRLDTDAWFSTPNFKGYAQYLDPEQPWYFGNTLAHAWRARNVVEVAGGVTVLSRESVRLLNRIFKTNEFLQRKHLFTSAAVSYHSYCHSKCSVIDDIIVAQCLRTVGVVPMNTLDEDFKNRFFCFRHDEVLASLINARYLWYWMDRFEGTAMLKNPFDGMVKRMIGWHGYKDSDEYKANRREIYLELNAKYIEPYLLDWSDYPAPPKPVTFLFNTSFDDLDEYLNVMNPPKMQKVWKGEDDLWNYGDLYSGGISLVQDASYDDTHQEL